MQQHTLNVLMQDHPGVLNRAVSLLRRRSFNIASLAVGGSEIPSVSRMTVVVDAADATQAVRQLSSLIEVLDVHDVTGTRHVQRETVMARIVAVPGRLPDRIANAQRDGAHVLDVNGDTAILELTDTPARIDAFIARLRADGVAELRRSGQLAMSRGAPESAMPTVPNSQADGWTDDWCNGWCAGGIA